MKLKLRKGVGNGFNPPFSRLLSLDPPANIG